MLGLEKLLAHGGEEVGASGEDVRGAAVLARMLAQECHCVGERAWTGELEFGEAHLPEAVLSDN